MRKIIQNQRKKEEENLKTFKLYLYTQINKV